METQSAALNALRRLARAFARLLLRAGVTSREAEQLLREAMVETALAEFGIRGRPTNASRVAMLTGLDRREVARIRDALRARGELESEPSHPLGQVLFTWTRDPHFSEADSARPLPLEGDGSFAELASRAAPGLPPVAVRKELERVGAVEVVDGQVHLRSTYYLLAGLNAQSIDRYGSVAGDLLTTLNHNVLGDDPERPRFEGRAQLIGVSPETAEALRVLLDERGQTFLEEIDEWMSSHADAGGEVRLGVGLYMIQDQSETRSDEDV